MTPLRVATFNIRNGRALDGMRSWPFRRRATLDAIVALDADVVGLQEVFAFQRRWLGRRLPGYEVRGTGRGPRGSGEQCPVLVRRDRARVVDARTRWFGATPDEPGTRLPGAGSPRIATCCRIAVQGWDQEVEVVNVHLDERSEVRRVAAVEQLLTWIDPASPCVVLGDFNADPGSPPVALLESVGLRSALGPDAGGTNHDFTGRTDGRRIDHVFVGARLGVVSAAVRHDVRRGARLPSDHWPVVAEVVLHPTG